VFCRYCTSNEVPELERLARTIARWEVPILRWHRTRLTNAATEGTNLVIKNIKRLGFGLRNFENYRLRLLLRCAPDGRLIPSHQYDPANHAWSRRDSL
jgi:transposase